MRLTLSLLVPVVLSVNVLANTGTSFKEEKKEAELQKRLEKAIQRKDPEEAIRLFHEGAILTEAHSRLVLFRSQELSQIFDIWKHYRAFTAGNVNSWKNYCLQLERHRGNALYRSMLEMMGRLFIGLSSEDLDSLKEETPNGRIRDSFTIMNLNRLSLIPIILKS